jgi:hypothetical protein
VITNWAVICVYVFAGSKTDAVRLWQDSEVCAFLTPRYPIAQNATNYGRWSTADSLYSITPEECYEPWFIAERTTYPMFDARYRGYGYNKQSQVCSLRETLHSNSAAVQASCHVTRS